MLRLRSHLLFLNHGYSLAVTHHRAAALVSSFTEAPLPADAVYFGEISLSGAVRPVAQAATRLKEAQKLGFARAVVPEGARAEEDNEPGLSLDPVSTLASLVADIAARKTGDGRRWGKRAGQQDG